MTDADTVAIPDAQRAGVSFLGRVTSALIHRLAELPPRFWLFFDITFGVIAPIVCLYFGSGFFEGDSDGPSFTVRKVAVHAFVAVQIPALCAWLAFRRPSSLAAGLFAPGALFASFMACIVFPFSMLIGGFSAVSFWVSCIQGEAPFDRTTGGIGLFSHVILALGFSTLLIPIVYTRNCLAALRSAFGNRVTSRSALALCAGVALSLLVPLATIRYFNHQADQATQAFLEASRDEELLYMGRVRELSEFADARELARQFRLERDPERRRKLSKAHKFITRRSLGE